MANVTAVKTPAAGAAGQPGLVGIQKGRLFLGSCLALISTSMFFAITADILGSLKAQFVLTNLQIGVIMGAATWGFTLATFGFGPLCDVIGMRRLLRLSFLCHAGGALLMIFAQGYWWLFAGALTYSLANGLVEAVCNPLVATIYPERKTQKLNQFHVWFPGGIVIGALLCFMLTRLGAGIESFVGLWQLKLGLTLIPTLLYGSLFLGQKFPATESHQAGVSVPGMFKETFSRPLFWMLLMCMMLTASVELGTNRWVPEVLKNGGMQSAILVLAYINGLMAILRFFAGPVVHRLAPTGILLGSAILSGAGLFWLSVADGLLMSFLAVTVFSVGITYFWPTMLGVTSERIPKGGPLALGVMGGMGMLIVGLVTTPEMGKIIDHYTYQRLDEGEIVTVLHQIDQTFPALAQNEPEKIAREILDAQTMARQVLAARAAGEALVMEDAVGALRSAIKVGGTSEAAGAAAALLQPAEYHGGVMSFRHVAPLTIILFFVFGGMYLRDRSRGGYKAVRI